MRDAVTFLAFGDSVEGASERLPGVPRTLSALGRCRPRDTHRLLVLRTTFQEHPRSCASDH